MPRLQAEPNCTRATHSGAQRRVSAGAEVARFKTWNTYLAQPSRPPITGARYEQRSKAWPPSPMPSKP